MYLLSKRSEIEHNESFILTPSAHTLFFFYKGWTKISSTHHPLVLPNFYTLISLIFFRQDTHPILFPYRYIYSGPYMKAHPLYLEKFEYSPSLIFPKFSVLIISSLIKASLIKKKCTCLGGNYPTITKISIAYWVQGYIQFISRKYGLSWYYIHHWKLESIRIWYTFI